jgi:hypothetical protein
MMNYVVGGVLEPCCMATSVKRRNEKRTKTPTTFCHEA